MSLNLGQTLLLEGHNAQVDVWGRRVWVGQPPRDNALAIFEEISELDPDFEVVRDVREACRMHIVSPGPDIKPRDLILDGDDPLQPDNFWRVVPGTRRNNPNDPVVSYIVTNTGIITTPKQPDPPPVPPPAPVTFYAGDVPDPVLFGQHFETLIHPNSQPRLTWTWPDVMIAATIDAAVGNVIIFIKNYDTLDDGVTVKLWAKASPLYGNSPQVGIAFAVLDHGDNTGNGTFWEYTVGNLRFDITFASDPDPGSQIDYTFTFYLTLEDGTNTLYSAPLSCTLHL